MKPHNPCLDFLLDLARDLDLGIAAGPMPDSDGYWLRVSLPTRTVEWFGHTLEGAAQRIIEMEFPSLADELSPPLQA